MPSEIVNVNEQTTFEDLGITLPGWDESQAPRLNLTVNQANDVAGSVTVNLEIARGKASARGPLTILGFRSIDPAIASTLEDVYKLITERLDRVRRDLMPTSLITSYETVSLAWLGLSDLSKEQLKGTKYDLHATELDDEKGLIKWHIEIEKDGFYLRRDYLMSGFVTAQQFDEEKVTEVVQKIRERNGGDLTTDNFTLKIRPFTHYHGWDTSKITAEDIARDYRGFGIEIPSNLYGVDLHWSVVSSLTTRNTLVFQLLVSFRKARHTLTFHIHGFEKLTIETVNDIVAKLPSQMITFLAKKRVTDYVVGQRYRNYQLGIDAFDDRRIDYSDISLTVLETDDRKGKVIVLFKIVSGNYSKEKKITIENYWDDIRRRVARDKISGQIDEIFQEFYHDKEISGLSAQQTSGLLSYDKTNRSNWWINGDHPKYAVGQKFPGRN
ncbi:lipoprotein 17-related variable surface protein [Mycoplasma sp. ATU-Cv-508]|uniref:lipoprotein 17-related variable surface protein n=1 Tax=Mycoplasma sp. ATU-Cv-508 TaxID=2048001 RepID=UPI000FDDD21D